MSNWLAPKSIHEILYQLASAYMWWVRYIKWIRKLFITDRIRRMGEGNVLSLSIGGRGEGVPSQGTYPPAKVPTSAKVPTLTIQVRMGEGIPQGTFSPTRYLLPRPGQDGGGVPQSTYHPPAKVPTLSPWIEQHMEYLICCGRYTCCVHAEGLSCFIVKLGWIYKISGIISDERGVNSKEETISSAKDLSLGERPAFSNVYGKYWLCENANYAHRKLNCLCK